VIELKQLKTLLKKYLEANEIGDLEDFYDYYTSEIIQTIKNHKEMLTKDEVRNSLIEFKKDELIFFDNDEFWVKTTKIPITSITKTLNKRDFDLNRDEFLWQIDLQVNLNLEDFEFNPKEIIDLLVQRLPLLNMKCTEISEHLYLKWFHESIEVNIWIFFNYILIRANLNERGSDFIDLIDYLNVDPYWEKDKQKILLMFPQITGVFYTYSNLKKIFREKYGLGLDFKISNIKFLRGSANF